LITLSDSDGENNRISLFFLIENRRRDVTSLNQSRGMSAKMAANRIRTHARTNQRCTLASCYREWKTQI